jgi:ElaB/YqjD/DUF883 family membrane-anchored ribosome-binding protein
MRSGLVSRRRQAKEQKAQLSKIEDPRQERAMQKPETKSRSLPEAAKVGEGRLTLGDAKRVTGPIVSAIETAVHERPVETVLAALGLGVFLGHWRAHPIQTACLAATTGLAFGLLIQQNGGGRRPARKSS